MQTIDTAAIRKDFPILAREVGGRPLVYLDSAATSQKPQAVIDELVNYYSYYNSNIHRGVHTLGSEATQAFENTRKKVADFIGADSPREIVFTRNATESINLVASTWGRANIKEDDEILVTPLEHHANLIPWQILAAEKKARLVFCNLTQDLQVDVESLARAITAKTKLVCVTQMSNVTGTIVALEKIAEICRKHGVKLLVDGAQSVPHLPTRVKDLDCDFLAFSLHKMLGPTGVGILWGRAELLEQMPPYMGGGNMISVVWRERANYNEIPWKFEAGTPNIADVIASAAAIDYLENLGMEAVRAHEIELVDYALRRFAAIEDVSVYGPGNPREQGGVLSFALKGIHPHDLGQIVNEEGIAIRVGHHCCQPLMRDLGIMGTARASFYIYTLKEEIDMLVDSLASARKVFKHVACR